jgi:hypothetical protein
MGWNPTGSASQFRHSATRRTDEPPGRSRSCEGPRAEPSATFSAVARRIRGSLEELSAVGRDHPMPPGAIRLPAARFALRWAGSCLERCWPGCRRDWFGACGWARPAFAAHPRSARSQRRASTSQRRSPGARRARPPAPGRKSVRPPLPPPSSPSRIVVRDGEKSTGADGPHGVQQPAGHESAADERAVPRPTGALFRHPSAHQLGAARPTPRCRDFHHKPTRADVARPISGREG